MGYQRISILDQRLHISGLPHGERGKHLWRLPAAVQAEMPLAVAEQSRFSAGARLRFRTNTTTLKLTGEAFSERKLQGIDCLIDGRYWRTLLPQRGGAMQMAVFQDLASHWRNVEIYFPAEQEVNVGELLLDEHAEIDAPLAYRSKRPLVFYGSSVVQGAGAGLSCMTSPAILSRTLNMDIHNLGFYGAGKAEPEVVAQIAARPAAVLVLDLGKSYGRQDISVYRQMLTQIRQMHENTPIVVVTPIFSARENFDSRFMLRSQSIRQVMSEAASGFSKTTVVDGLTLLGPDDWTGLSVDGLHPADKGYELIAERLRPVLESCLSD